MSPANLSAAYIKILTREDKQLSLNILRKGTILKNVFMKITSEQMVKITEEERTKEFNLERKILQH